MKNERKPGRPRSETAHQAILEAANHLMESIPIREITIQGIAKQAGVGKPTIYRWWDTKCSLVMDAFLASAAPQIPFPKTDSVVDALKEQLRLVIKLLRGPSGRIVAQMIGEGQSAPDILKKFRERFFTQLLAPARTIIERGKKSGEIDKNIDMDLAIDLLYGPIYYRLLVGHQPLNDAFARNLPERVVAILKTVQPG